MALLVGLAALFDMQSELGGASGGNAIIADPVHADGTIAHADVAPATHDGALIQADTSHDTGLISATAAHTGGANDLAPVVHDHRADADKTETASSGGTPFTGVGTWHQMTAK
jgi:hypothetical protein